MAGYNDWLRLHRYVRRGEKAIKIIVPMFRTTMDEESDGDRPFHAGREVVAVAQTQGQGVVAVPVPKAGSIGLRDNYFQPANASDAPGTTLMWINYGQEQHTAASSSTTPWARTTGSSTPRC